MAKAYLSAQDPNMLTRTWEEVMNRFCSRGLPRTQDRRHRTMSSKPFELIRRRKLLETTAEDFLNVLNSGGNSAHLSLRCLHNLAQGLGWLPWPALPNKLWPTMEIRKKRGVTWDEHEPITAAERNLERRLYYEVLWEIGASQTDGAMLGAGNIDWSRGVLIYQRKKTGGWANLRIGNRLASVLKQLPSQGPLFPRISKTSDSARSAEFYRRCRLLAIRGISLHSYRYAWAERAMAFGYPERWAQSALGHTSRAIHQAYAKGATVVCPPLEDYSPSNVRKKNVNPGYEFK